MGIPLYVICCFSLAAFNNFSLSSIFVSFDYCVSRRVSAWVYPAWILCDSWTWVAISFPTLGKFLTIISSNIFSGPFSHSSPSGTPIMRMLLHLILSQRSLRLSSFLFILFFFILFYGSEFHHCVFQVTYLFFCLSYSAIDSF